MKCKRLSWDLLVRTVDEELSASEAAWVPAHIAACGDCQNDVAAIEGLSSQMQAVVEGVPVVEELGERDRLAAQMRQLEHAKPARPPVEKVFRRFGWGMAIAASLAIGVLLAPKPRVVVSIGVAPVEQAAAGLSTAIEVDGETFVALPYSNPDLPTSAPRIVQMEVPVSSLAEIGIATVPVVNEAFNQDRTVLADVLLGADGQPLGVHVVSWE